jgi:FkbM family methyltransferase
MNVKKITKKILGDSHPMLLIYKAIRDEYKFLVSKPKKNKLGFFFSGNTEMENNTFEKIETNFFMKLMPLTTKVINIGANVGYYCCIALAKKKKVIAFEPIYQNLRYLLRNIYVNNWNDRIAIYPLALSSDIGVTKIYGQTTGASLIKGWAQQSDFSLTPQAQLDCFETHLREQDKPLILIDVEGSEFNVLQGSKKILRRKNKPYWLIEICINEHQPKGIKINPDLLKTFLLFKKFGYEGVLLDQIPRVIDFEEIKNIQKTKKNSLTSHSFLFVDKKLKNKIFDVIKN